MIEYYKKNCSTELVNYSDAGSTVDYKSILNAITEGIYAIDEHGTCVYCNSACWRILGYNASEDILGKNMHELIHYANTGGGSYSYHTCTIMKALAKGIETFSDSEVFWAAGGKAVPVAYYVYPQFKNGQVSGAVVTFSDISGEKKQLNKLEASEARYRNIFQNANAGIIYVDKDGYTISANQAFLDLVQYSLAELQQSIFER